jgi:hypothetical protein
MDKPNNNCKDLSYMNINMDQISKDNFDDPIEIKVLELNKNEEKSKKELCFPLCFIPSFIFGIFTFVVAIF